MYLKKMRRIAVSEVPPPRRSIDAEDAYCLDLSAIKMEASRCFNCGCVAVNASDMAAALVALAAKIRTTKRTADADDFFVAGPMRSTVMDADELVTEIEIPATKAGSKQVFLTFRTRESVDFPIVSVASIFNMDGEMVRDARVVLAAAAPVPLRIRQVEEFLKGKVLTEEVAEAAGLLVAKETNPLSKNKYKVQTTKALVRRAILSVAKGV